MRLDSNRLDFLLATAVAEAHAEYYHVEDGVQTAVHTENMFAALMEAAKVYSLGQILGALYAVGGAVPAEYVERLREEIEGA